MEVVASMSDKGEVGGWTRGLTYSLREIAPWQAREREESCPSFRSRKSRGDGPLRRILLRNNRWGNRGTRYRREVHSFCSKQWTETGTWLERAGQLGKALFGSGNLGPLLSLQAGCPRKLGKDTLSPKRSL